MKKNYFFLAACALTLTACTSESVLEDEVLDRREISFQNVVQHLTRQGDVTDLTGNALSQFQVYGYYTLPEADMVAYQVFNNVTVTRASGDWKYSDTKRYWVPGANYYFYAYSCGDAGPLCTGMGSLSFDMGANRTHQQRVLKLNNYVCNNTHQHDLIFASNTGATQDNAFAGILGKESDNSAVAFQFKHILSKVNAKFTSQLPDDYQVSISNVTIENIRDRGSYSPLSGWSSVVRMSGSNRHFVYLLDTSDATVDAITTSATADPVFTNSAFVLPYKYKGEKTKDDWSGEETNTFVSLEFDLTITRNGATILQKHLVGEFDPDWTAGYTYTYNLNIDGDAAGLEIISFTTEKDDDGNEVSDWNKQSSINFKLEVNEWEEGETTEIDVPGWIKKRK